MGRRGVTEPKCWRCKKKGHEQSKCPEAAHAGGESKRCFCCGSDAHLAPECPLNDRIPGDPWPRVRVVVHGDSRPSPQSHAIAVEPAAEARCAATRLSVLITTSPVPSNPSTMMLEAVLASFRRVEGLVDCPLIIVCDGFRNASKSTWKAGQITEDAAEQYDGYQQNLRHMLETGQLPRSTQLVILEGRNGQAFAVQAGLAVVQTRFVLVHQHDLEFPFDFGLSRVLDVLEDPDNDVKYVGMPLLTNLNYEGIAFQHHGVRVHEQAIGSVRLVPIIFWYDSTHITSVEHYRTLVFGPDEKYRPGNFVEETFGIRQRNDIMKNGMSVHSKYGTYHCLSHSVDGSRRPLICHLNGNRFLTPEQRSQRGYPSDPPVECYPSRVMMNRRQRRLRMILDTILSLSGVDLADMDSVRNILAKEFNATRRRCSDPSSLCLPSRQAVM